MVDQDHREENLEVGETAAAAPRRRRQLDRELRAMGAIVDELEWLTEDELGRVWRFLADRFGPRVKS
jgi:hypothetical protein